jgi:hypothetical protein
LELITFVHFFFAIVVGRLGSFHLVDSLDQIHWTANADGKQISTIAPQLIPLSVIGRDPDGHHRLRGTVLFKNAIFRTDILVGENLADNSYTKLTDEELLADDLSVEYGEYIDLVVRN